MKRFSEIEKQGIPSLINESKGERKWNEILQKMVKTFDMILNEERYIDDLSKYDAYIKEINEGLELFKTYFTSLWD